MPKSIEEVLNLLWDKGFAQELKWTNVKLTTQAIKELLKDKIKELDYESLYSEKIDDMPTYIRALEDVNQIIEGL